MYYAEFKLYGEKIRKVADSWEALDLKVFGRAYAPSRDSVLFFSIPDTSTNKES